DVGSEVAARVDAEAERLTEWLGGVRVLPSFPTPLQRELAR
nr:winged helix DNA-binding domain-containing protein [Nocardioidaceae bacterium]